MNQSFTYVILIDDRGWEPGDCIGIETDFCSPALDPEAGAFWQILRGDIISQCGWRLNTLPLTVGYGKGLRSGETEG